MLIHLADPDSPLRLLQYITFRSMMAGATALLVGFIIAPWMLAKLRMLKMAQSFRSAEEVGKLAELHAGKKNTPTMGGLIIYVSVMVSALLWAEPNPYVVVALFVYTGLTVIGFMDDYLKVSKKNSKGLPGRQKLIGQAILTLISLMILYLHPQTAEQMRELWVPFLKEPIMIMPFLVALPFFFVVMAGSSNAINLTDGVDGLAIGCTISVALAYAIMSYAAGHAVFADYLNLGHIPGAGELTVLCTALLGGSLVFLWYNAHPAEVFMGDTGSLALGGLIGTIALMVQQPFTLVIVGGIFVMEAMSVILQVGSFKTTGRRIFKMAPIHHHFELKGWPETKVVIRFWLLSLIFAIAGLATLKIR